MYQEINQNRKPNQEGSAHERNDNYPSSVPIRLWKWFFGELCYVNVIYPKQYEDKDRLEEDEVWLVY